VRVTRVAPGWIASSGMDTYQGEFKEQIPKLKCSAAPNTLAGVLREDWNTGVEIGCAAAVLGHARSQRFRSRAVSGFAGISGRQQAGAEKRLCEHRLTLSLGSAP